MQRANRELARKAPRRADDAQWGTGASKAAAVEWRPGKGGVLSRAPGRRGGSGCSLQCDFDADHAL